MDCSPPGSSVHRILQPRILEWFTCPPPGDLPNSGIEPASLIFPLVAGRILTTSRLGSLRTSLKVSASLVLSNRSVMSKTFAASWTVAHQAPLSMEFSRQEYWLLLLHHFSRVRLCVTHRRQATRLPCPWDSPGKNTGVGCHCLLQYMKVKSKSEVTQSCPTLSDPMDCSPPGSSVHGSLQARVLESGAIAFSGEIFLSSVQFTHSVVSDSL